MSQGFASPFLAGQQASTVTTYTSGSGTYTVPAGVQYLVVTMCGGGGGGGGVRVGAGAGGNGGTTSFGSWTAIGGNGAIASNGPNNPSSGATGGTGGASGTGTQIFRVAGASGGSGIGITSIGMTSQGPGGGSILSGGNAWFQGTADVNGLPGMNQGGGGAGAAGSDNSAAGGGGGGEQVQFLITSPSSTYSYAVGAGGTAGAGSATGGAGGSGVIIIEEYYSLLGITGTLNLPLSTSQGGTGVTNTDWTAASLTFNPTTQGIVGTTTNNDADAGYVGELQSIYNTTGVVGTANVAGNVTSISLSAGDWDVYGQCTIIPDFGQVITLGYSALTTTSATFALADFGTAAWIGNNFVGDGSSGLGLVSNLRLSLSTTTTVYLAYYTNVGTTIKGGIYARRRR